VSLVAVAKLMPPNTLKKLLTEDAYFKGLIKTIGREVRGFSDSLRLFYVSFKGGATVKNADDLRTLLDLQYFSDLDIITIQHTPELSAEEFASMFSFALRWSEERRVEKPLMPVLSALEDKVAFKKLLQPILKRDVTCVGLDMRSGFYYHALRSLEEAKRKSPEVWLHAFQVPPKIRLAGKFTRCSAGMMMPYFGVDSYTRHVVPPPPFPIVKEKVNFFNRGDWGVFKWKEYRKLHGEKLSCDCPVCEGLNLDGFFSGTDFEVLQKAKVHDYFAERSELKVSSTRIKEGTFARLLKSKPFPKEILKALKQPARKP
jgi:hypothetical protein